MKRTLKFCFGILLLLLFSSFAFADFTTNNELWLQMQSSPDAGNTDSSSNGYFFTNNGATYDITDNAYLFDGSTHYLNKSGDDLEFTTSFSYGAWAKRDTTGSFHTIIERGESSGGANYILVLRNDGQVSCAFSNDAGDTFEDLRYTYATGTSSFHHYYCVYNSTGTNLSLYIDGDYKASITTAVTPKSSGTQVVKVGESRNSDRHFDGYINGFTMFSYALSSTDVSNLYSEGRDYNPYSVSPIIGDYDEYFITNLTSRYYLNDTNFLGLVNESNGIDDSWGLNDGQIYGKSFYPGTNNGATISNSSPVNNSLEQFGGYYEFDGVNDQIDTTLTNVASEEVTLCTWINPKEPTVPDGIVSKDDGANRDFYLRLTGGVVDFTIFNTAGSAYQSRGTTSVPAYGWSFICGVVDNNEVKAYYNGVWEDGRSDAVTGTRKNSTSIVEFGIQRNANYFNGSIDEVKIWDRALSQTEIQEEMTANAVANPQGIVAYYDFNEKSGTTAYDNNHLSVGARQSTASLTDPVFKWDKATNFDGVDDRIEVPNFYSSSISDITISTWAKFEKLGTRMCLVTNLKSNGLAGYQVCKESNNKIRFWQGTSTGGNVYSTSTVNADEWVNIIVTYNSSDSKVYLNGNLDNSGTANGVIVTPDRDLEIGDWTSSTAEMNGTIGDVRIYERALTQDEITTLYNGLKRVNITAETFLSSQEVNEFNVTSIYGNVSTLTGIAQLDVPYGNISFNWLSDTYEDQTVTEEIDSQNSIVVKAYKYFTEIYAKNKWNQSFINTFQVNDEYNNYSTTNGTIKIKTEFDTMNLSYTSPNYISLAFQNVDMSSNVTKELYQTVTNITATTKEGKQVINEFNLTTEEGTFGTTNGKITINPNIGNYSWNFSSDTHYPEPNIAFNVDSVQEELNIINITDSIARFIDASTSNSLSNSNVTLTYQNGSTYSLVTDSNGYVQFGGYRTGSRNIYDLTFEDSAGYNTPITFNVNISESSLPSNETYEITRTSINISIFYRVNSSVFTENATVVIQGLGEFSTTNGTIFLRNVSILSDDYTVQVFSDDYFTEQRLITYNDQSDLDVSFYMLKINESNSNTIRVEVRDATQSRVSNARTVLLEYKNQDLGYSQVSECYTNSVGQCLFLVEGDTKTYKIVATKTINNVDLSASTGDEGIIVKGDVIDGETVILEDNTIILTLSAITPFGNMIDKYLQYDVDEDFNELTNTSSISVNYQMTDGTDITVCVGYYEVNMANKVEVSKFCTTGSVGVGSPELQATLNRSKTYEARVFVQDTGLILDSYTYKSIFSLQESLNKYGIVGLSILGVLIIFISIGLYAGMVPLIGALIIVVAIAQAIFFPNWVVGSGTVLEILLGIQLIYLGRKKEDIQ